MSNFPPELIEEAKAVKTAEELLALAKLHHIEITIEEANTYFAQLVPVFGELSDDDLDNVAGGGCSEQSVEYPAIPAYATNMRYKSRCLGCGCGNGLVLSTDENAWKVICNDCSTTVSGSGRKAFWDQFDIY